MTAGPEPAASSAPGPWQCPGCGSARAAEDGFCARCGTRRPETEPEGHLAKRGFPVLRALVLNGIIIGVVLVALVFGRPGGGPTVITFEPAAWRCDGSARTWIAVIPASAADVRLDWMIGGTVGDIRATSTTARAALDPDPRQDGQFRVTSTDPAAPECGLAPGGYTLAIRDAVSGVLVASGSVDLAP